MRVWFHTSGAPVLLVPLDFQILVITFDYALKMTKRKSQAQQVLNLVKIGPMDLELLHKMTAVYSVNRKAYEKTVLVPTRVSVLPTPYVR